MFRFLSLVLLISVSVSAQTTYNFLSVDNSPRAAAVAGGFVAATEDANVIFYNPAGINTLKANPISFSFLKHLEGINSLSLAASHSFNNIGRLSAGVQYINYGSFIASDKYGNKTGTFNASEFALSVGYGNMIDENFYYGANVRFIYSGIENYSSTGVSADIGLLYLIPQSKWSFGFSVLNIGKQLSNYYDIQESLPMDVRVGMTKELAHLPLKFYFSINHLANSYDNIKDRFSAWTVGGELKLSRSFWLRLGYDNAKRDDLSLGLSFGIAGFSAGFGLNIKNYLLDYSFSSFGPIGNLHRFGLSTSF
jgi:hypothetical protein